MKFECHWKYGTAANNVDPKQTSLDGAVVFSTIRNNALGARTAHYRFLIAIGKNDFDAYCKIGMSQVFSIDRANGGGLSDL